MKKLGIIALILVSALVLAFGVTDVAEAKTADWLKWLEGEKAHRDLRVGTECAFAPYNWQEYTPTEFNIPIENLDGFYADGYDIQIAKIIAEKLDANLIIVKIAWSGLIEALNSGQIDMIIAGMGSPPPRREAVLFSEPYHETEYAVMVVNGSKYENATCIQDFAGASMLGQRDTQLDSVIDQIEGVNHLVPVDTVPNQITRLVQGTCDAIVVNYENTPEYLAIYPNFKVIRFAPDKGFTLDFTGPSIGLRKISRNLLKQVNAALEGISVDERKAMFQAAIDRQPK